MLHRDARKFLVIGARRLLHSSVYGVGRKTMKLKTFGYGALIIAATVALAIGSASPSDAKSKKKMAAPPPPPQWGFCFETYKPVCAVKGGEKQNYVNACFAAKDGAKVVSEGACPKAKPAVHKKKKAMKKAPKEKAPAKKK
jgi:hypothetical protein